MDVRRPKGLGYPRGSPKNPLISLGPSGYFGPTTDIIFVNGSISTADDVGRWSDSDLINKTAIGIITKGICATISDNHFYNLRDGIVLYGDQTIVEDNTIDDFSNDGIDVVASNQTIRHNAINPGRHPAGDPLHADGIEGWTLNGVTNKNLVIDRNKIQKNGGDGRIDYLQGITIFDGKWDDIIISNNVVITNTWHGITLMGVNNAKS